MLVNAFDNVLVNAFDNVKHGIRERCVQSPGAARTCDVFAALGAGAHAN